MAMTLRDNAARQAKQANAKTGRKRNVKETEQNDNDYTEEVTLKDLMKVVGNLTSVMEVVAEKVINSSPKKSRDEATKESKGDEEIVQVDVPDKITEGQGQKLPPPGTLRGLPELQRQVQDRLQSTGLFSGTGDVNTQGKGSGRNKTLEQMTTRKVDWPHHHVRNIDLAPGSRDAYIHYDDLEFPQFVQGYIHSAMAADSHISSLMFKHLEELAADTAKYGFEVVRKYHGMILEEMELGEMTWESEAKFMKLRQQFVWSNTPLSMKGEKPSQPAKSAAKKKVKNAARKFPCKPYQLGQCTNPEDLHQTAKGPVEHICSFCYSKGFIYPHPEFRCYKKQKAASKNEQSALQE